jgi:hypothetical protein
VRGVGRSKVVACPVILADAMYAVERRTHAHTHTPTPI